MRALVVFSGDSDHPLAWLLRPGFRHVFCAVQSAGLWIEIDGRRGVPTVKYMSTDDFDLAGHYRGQGFTVVETGQADRPGRAPLSVRSCVGLVKTVLCIRSAALTPWGLYRFLDQRISPCS